MLRTALLAFALGLFAVGLGTWMGGAAGTVPLIVWGAVLSAAVLLERWRYVARGGAAPGQWQVTDERFIDPESGKAMQVLYNPRTGERRYEPVDPAAGVPPA